MRLIVLTAMIAGVLISCVSRPKLLDSFYPDDSYQLRPLRRMQAAPIVVVGRLLSVRSIDGVRNAARMPELKIEPLEITLGIENVLRGEVSRRTLTFYYFVFSPHNRKVFGVFIYAPVLGERRIFFLTEKRGITRSVGDVADYTIPVRSGSHKGLTPPPGSSLGEAISWILLTPGEGCQPERFAEDLHGAFSISAEFGSQRYALALLGRLAQNEEKSIRSQASDLIAAVAKR